MDKGLPSRRDVLRAVAAPVWSGLQSASGAEPGPRWWERGQDTWYYKDDWKALYLSGSRDYRQTVSIPGRVRAAYAYVWATGATLRVNGRVAGSDRDDGTIEDYDLAPFLKPGDNLIEILGVRREAILEGAAVLESGEEIHFGTDAGWGDAETRTSPERKTGPRGYVGDTHCARILAVTAEQKAKALVSRLNSVRARILDRDRYVFWRARDPREALDLSRPTAPRRTWNRIERLIEEARGPIAEAGALIRAGRFERVAIAVASAVEKTRAAERLLAQLMRELEKGRAHLNRSDRNRLGWVTSTEPLNNDVAFWECEVSPQDAGTIGLAGMWEFQIDPDGEGARDDAWRTIYAPSKYGWERQGVIQENYAVKGRSNKPYNGLAWYRKRLRVPAAWAGSDLVLRPGIRGENVYWVAANGRFLQPTSAPGSREAEVTIPADAIRFGRENTIELRVYNANNLGGITNSRVRLSRAGYEPESRRSACGAGIARETVFQTKGGLVTQVVFSSALSPAAAVATDGLEVRIGSWAERGYSVPERCAFVTNGKPTSAPIREMPKAAVLEENWILLWSGGNAPKDPRPLLIVFEQRPAAIETGGEAVVFRYEKPGARLLLIRPFSRISGTPGGQELERVRLWSRALMRYPVGYAERLAFDGGRCAVRMEYEYFGLNDSWRTPALEIAPLPMLFSYALDHRWPGAVVDAAATNLGCRAASGYYPQSGCGEYRAILRASTVSYCFDRREPPIHLKGFGTLREELRIGEPVFADAERWGFNSVRPQMYFHEMPGFFEHRQKHWDENSRLVFDEHARAVMDRLIELHRRHGQMFIMNWFWNLDRQGNEPHGAVVNSSRYWKFAAATRQHILDFWTRMAEHCRDLPPDAVCYDLLNEPSDVCWGDYNRLTKEFTAAVRKIDKVHRLTLEAGGGWAQPEDLDLTEPVGDANTIYQFHGYGPHTGDCHRNDLWFPRYEPDSEAFRSYDEWEERLLAPIRFSIRNHCELFHGEFGISFIGPGESPRRWVEALLSLHEKYRTHWSWWSYSGNDIHRTGLVAGDRLNPLVETLSAFARKRKPE